VCGCECVWVCVGVSVSECVCGCVCVSVSVRVCVSDVRHFCAQLKNRRGRRGRDPVTSGGIRSGVQRGNQETPVTLHHPSRPQVSIRVYIYMYVYKYIYIYMYVYKYIYIHTYIPSFVTFTQNKCDGTFFGFS